MQLLGGYNRSLSHGDIHWTRIVEKNYYKVLMTNLSVGNSTIDMPCNEVSYVSILFDLRWCNMNKGLIFGLQLARLTQNICWL